MLTMSCGARCWKREPGETWMSLFQVWGPPEVMENVKKRRDPSKGGTKTMFSWVRAWCEICSFSHFRTLVNMRWSKTGHSQTMCFAKISKRSLYSVVRRRNGGKNDG